MPKENRPGEVAQTRDDRNCTTKQRTASIRSYVFQDEKCASRCSVDEQDALWTSDAQVESHFAALNWAVVPIHDDGNCLFRAVSAQLYNNEQFHLEIRKRAVDVIQRNRKEFQPFVNGEQIEVYCARMRQDGKRGGHLELYAVARLFNIHIVVHTGPARTLRVTNDDVGGRRKRHLSPTRTLHLLYKDNHYNSLIQGVRSTTNASKAPQNDVGQDQHVQKQYSVTKFDVLYEETDLPECSVQFPKQALFSNGKRRLSDSTRLFNIQSSSYHKVTPEMETAFASESPTTSNISTATSASEEERIEADSTLLESERSH